MLITFHADDYGINPQQSKRMMRCYQNGCLNSFSAMPNSVWLKECMELADQAVMNQNQEILCGIHLNLAEGKCCADKEKVSLLVDQEGRFRLSYGKMMLLSLIHGRTFRKQVKEECMAQILRMLPYIKNGIRIDSHRHCHMIPAVFRGLYDACEQLQVEVTYIRWPVETFWPYLRHREIWKQIPPANIVKNLLIRIFAVINGPLLVAAGWKSKTAVFFGVLLTDRMFYKSVKSLLPDFIKYAQKRNKHLEVLFHPGAIYPGEEYLDCKYMEFYQKKNRAMEADTLRKLQMSNQASAAKLQREDHDV